MVEHLTADQEVSGSNPDAPCGFNVFNSDLLVIKFSILEQQLSKSKAIKSVNIIKKQQFHSKITLRIREKLQIWKFNDPETIVFLDK